MGTLTGCLSSLDTNSSTRISKRVQNEIRDLANGLKADGYKVKDAEIESITQHIKNLEQNRKSIINQIRKAAKKQQQLLDKDKAKEDIIENDPNNSMVTFVDVSGNKITKPYNEAVQDINKQLEEYENILNCLRN